MLKLHYSTVNVIMSIVQTLYCTDYVNRALAEALKSLLWQMIGMS